MRSSSVGEGLQPDAQRPEDSSLEKNGFGEKTLRQSWAPTKELSFSPAI